MTARSVCALLIPAILAGSASLSSQSRRLTRTPEDGPAGERRLALVIGNDAYPAAPLRNGVNDAKAIGGALRNLGFEVTQIADATLPTLDRAVSELASQLRANDVVVFFYAGHGLQVDNENYLVPVDFSGRDPADVKYRAFPAGQLLDKLKTARIRVLIFDACRDNPFSGTRSGTHGLAGMQAQGALIAYSTAPGQTSSDNPGGANGVFTQQLLEELSVPGESARDLFYRVRERVYDATNGKQVPWLSDGLIGQFVFSAARPAVANLTIRTEPSNVSIFVDGQPRGAATPELVVSGLTTGDHEIVARRDGFGEMRQTVHMATSPASVQMNLTAVTVAPTGGLHLTTTPTNAAVLIDGIARGQAPADVTGLAPGVHRIEVTQTGYVPYYDKVDVSASTVRAINVSLEPMLRRTDEATTGILYVTSEPSDAQVYLDGRLIGATPATLESVAAGPHKLRIAKQYYTDRNVDIAAEPRVVVRSTVHLDPVAATLTLEADFASDANTLFFDNKAMGPLKRTQSVASTAGVHQLRVRRMAGDEIEQRIELTGGPQRIQLRGADYFGALTVLADVGLDQLLVDGIRVDLPPVTMRDVRRGTVSVAGTARDRYFNKTVSVAAGDTAFIRIDARDLLDLNSLKDSPLRSELLGFRWTDDRDIGPAQTPGSASYNRAVLSVTGSNRVHFAYMQLEGDGQLVARILSMCGDVSAAKSGVMIRSTPMDDGQYAFMLVHGDGGVALQDASGFNRAGSRVKLPFWVKIARKSGFLEGFASSDGVNWKSVGRIESPWSESSAYVGLAVTSTSGAKPCVATFDNVSARH